MLSRRRSWACSSRQGRENTWRRSSPGGERRAPDSLQRGAVGKESMQPLLPATYTNPVRHLVLLQTALISGVLYFFGSGRMVRQRITVFTLLLASFLLASCGGGGSSGSMTAAPSDLQYPTPPAFVINSAIAALTPTVVGEVMSYSVSPGLPAGLSLNTTTGVISGTPTGVAAKANYTVKATNAGGSTTAIVSIEVMGASTVPPSDLKYPNPPEFVV